MSSPKHHHRGSILERLGPEWTLEEVDAFYSAYKELEGRDSPIDWTQFSHYIPQRTANEIRELYEKQRGYLSRPNISVRGLYRAIRGMYSTLRNAALDGSGAESGEEPKKKRKVKEEKVLSDIPLLQHLCLRGKDRISKRKPSLFLLPLNGEGASRVIEESPTAYSQLPLKLRGKRKGAHALPSSTASLESLPYLSMFAVTPGGRRFCTCNHFHGAVDEFFFRENEFRICLQDIGLSNVDRLSRKEWSYIRSVLGKVRRFSPAFLAQEKKKLRKYREVVRKMQDGKTPKGKDEREILEYCSAPFALAVGQRVIVYEPTVDLLLEGSVISKLESGRYRIRMSLDKEKHVVDLEDTDVASLDSPGLMLTSPRYTTTSTSNLADDSGSVRWPLGALQRPNRSGGGRTFHLDPRSVACAEYLVEIKRRSLLELKRLNDVAENEEKVGIEFRKKYATLIINLKNINKYLDPILVWLASRPSGASVAGDIMSLPDVDVLRKAAIDMNKVVVEGLLDAGDISTSEMRFPVESMLVSCTTLGLAVQQIIDRGVSHTQLGEFLPQCTPRFSENQKVFDELREVLEQLQHAIATS